MLRCPGKRLSDEHFGLGNPGMMMQPGGFGLWLQMAGNHEGKSDMKGVVSPYSVKWKWRHLGSPLRPKVRGKSALCFNLFSEIAESSGK